MELWHEKEKVEDILGGNNYEMIRWAIDWLIMHAKIERLSGVLTDIGKDINNVKIKYVPQVAQLENENEKLTAELERRDKALRDISEFIANWMNAYPLSAFPEPDLKKARELLKAGGLTLDCLCASNMRHVINRVWEMFCELFPELKDKEVNHERPDTP